MWGQIIVEASLQQNFNFGFSTYKSDILIHLSQWQYWWWFWFSLVWVAYYYIIVYCVTRRTFSFNPVMNTSIRGHGKWGDFLVALIPLSWCGNILINSNFILRMIEWQNESSLFTLRVQGKQWYWVYKFDSTSASSILSSPKNIGNNKWLVWTPNDVLISDSYYQTLQLAAQLEFNDTYRSLLNKNENTAFDLNYQSFNSKKVSTTNNIVQEQQTSQSNKSFLISPNSTLKLQYCLSNSDMFLKLKKSNLPYYTSIYFNFNNLTLTTSLKTNYADSTFVHYDYLKVDDSSDTMSSLRLNTKQQPLRLVKLPLNLFIAENKSTLENFFFTFNFSDSTDSNTLKVNQLETFWGFRQKKYKRLKKFLFKPKTSYDPSTHLPSSLSNAQRGNFKSILTNSQFDTLDDVQGGCAINSNDNTFTTCTSLHNKQLVSSNLKEKTFLTENKPVESNNFDYYKAVRFAKLRTDLLSVTLARRLLRVKRTLVLPAHINITVITNSYDVVHSWFIPGLGIKLDCVPGRSTHHTFYIDNIGFYYGQCAEICGRYHHHMPIRICALTFDQFLVWWHKKALPRLNRLNSQKSLNADNARYTNYFDKSLSTNKHEFLKVTSFKYNW